MPGVERRGELPQPVADGVLRELVDLPAAQMATGVARRRVEPQQRGVDHEHEGAHAHADPPVTGQAEGHDGVDGEDDVEDQGQDEEVAVQVLQDEREPRLAGVAAVAVGHRARRRRLPEAPVVGLAVVVAGEPEPDREW